MEDEDSDELFSYDSDSISSPDSLSEISTTDDSDDEPMGSSDNSGPPGPTSPSNDNRNELNPVSPQVRQQRARSPNFAESNPHTDDELTVSMASSVSDSNPPSPTVSTLIIQDNTDSLSSEDSDATRMVTSTTRAPLYPPSNLPQFSSRLLFGENNTYGPRSPQHENILPPNSPENVPAADILQVVNEVAPIPQGSSEPVVGNGETNNPEPTLPEETAADLNNSCISVLDEGSLCSICMEPLTNSGKHRVVCLQCGHIFGQSCLEHWIKNGCSNGAKRCPTCNKKACLKDIRILYLPKVVPLDTVERDRLIEEKEVLTAHKRILELKLSKCKLEKRLSIRRFENRITQLEKELRQAKRGKLTPPCKEDFEEKDNFTLVKLLHSVDLCKQGGCRVLAYNPILNELVVSQPSGNTLFAGFGVRVLNSVDFQPSRYMFLHSKMIRDLAFHPDDLNMLLSVSLDQTAKLVDLGSNLTVHTFKGEGPLWSCCWDVSNPHLMLIGSQMGKVCQYDRRMTEKYVNTWSTTSNMTPVVSLASVPSIPLTPFPQGGFLSCRLNGVFAYARHGNDYSCQELGLRGPFMSMRYDSITQNLVTSARPSSYCPYVRIGLNLVDVDNTGNVCLPEIHTFNGGTSARFLSRLTTVPFRNDSIIIAHHESGRNLSMWHSNTGNLFKSIATREPIIDLANMCANNSQCLFASLSEKQVCIYKVA